MCCELDDFGRIEAARGRHHVDAAVHHVGQVVQATPVRQRRGMQHHIAGFDPLHLAEVAQARLAQLPRTEHHALRPAGGAAGVEQPSRVGVAALGGIKMNRRPGRQRRQLAVQGRAGAYGSQCVTMLGGAKRQAGAAVLQDPTGLARMQLGIDRHRRRAGPPGAPQHDQVLGPVRQEQAHPVAGGHALRMQPCGQHRRALRQLGVAAPHLAAVADGCAFAEPLRGACEPERGVHRCLSCVGPGRAHGGPGTLRFNGCRPPSACRGTTAAHCRRRFWRATRPWPCVVSG